MFDDLLSGPLFIFELLNPQPLMQLDLMEIKGLMNLCAMPLVGISVYLLLKSGEIFPEAQAKVIAIAMALISGMFIPPGVMVIIAFQYAVIARILDGFLFGLAIGEIFVFARNRFFTPSPLMGIFASSGTLLSLLGLVLIGRSCFRLFKAFAPHPAIATALAATCVAGLIAVPNVQTQTGAILFALIFPCASIIGTIVALRID